MMQGQCVKIDPAPPESREAQGLFFPFSENFSLPFSQAQRRSCFASFYFCSLLIAACGGLNVWGAIHYRRKEHSQAIDLCSM